MMGIGPLGGVGFECWKERRLMFVILIMMMIMIKVCLCDCFVL